MAVPHVFDPSETAKSAEVNENFAALASGDALDDDSIAIEKLQHDARGVTGSIVAFAGQAVSVPDGWLICNGQSLVRATYPELFDIIGTTYGAADSTHFNVPNLMGRVITMIDGSSEFSSLGQTGGEKQHTLTTNEIPAHSHGTDMHANKAAAGSAIGGQGTNKSGSTTANAGGGAGHNNIQPYMALNYMIKA